MNEYMKNKNKICCKLCVPGGSDGCLTCPCHSQDSKCEHKERNYGIPATKCSNCGLLEEDNFKPTEKDPVGSSIGTSGGGVTTCKHNQVMPPWGTGCRECGKDPDASSLDSDFIAGKQAGYKIALASDRAEIGRLKNANKGLARELEFCRSSALAEIRRKVEELRKEKFENIELFDTYRETYEEALDKLLEIIK